MSEDYLWINEYNRNRAKMVTLIFLIFVFFIPFLILNYLLSFSFGSMFDKIAIETNMILIPIFIFPLVVFFTFKILFTKYKLTDYHDNYYLYIYNRFFPKNILTALNWIILDKIYLSRNSINKVNTQIFKIKAITFSGLNKSYTVHILPFYYNEKLDIDTKIVKNADFKIYKRNITKFYLTVLFIVCLLLILLSLFTIFLRNSILFYNNNFDLYEYLALFFEFSLPIILAYLSAQLIFDLSHKSLLIFDNYIIHGSYIINLQDVLQINQVERKYCSRKTNSIEIMLRDNSIYYINDIYKFGIGEIYEHIKPILKII